MCVMSMIGDHYHDKWKDVPLKPYINYPDPLINGVSDAIKIRQELNDLKKEVLEMKELLKKAIEYDKRNNEPHCEVEEKIETLKKVAELVGVSLDDVFKK